MKALGFISSRHQAWLWESVENLPSSASSKDFNFKTIVFGGFGGRADHAFAQVHQLYQVAQDDDLKCGDIYLINAESICFLLISGENRIFTPVAPNLLGKHAGIIPFGKPCSITTKGFKWDVELWKTEFGKQISTSNHIEQALVTVLATERILFCVEIAERYECHPKGYWNGEITPVDETRSRANSSATKQSNDLPELPHDSTGSRPGSSGPSKPLDLSMESLRLLNEENEAIQASLPEKKQT